MPDASEVEGTPSVRKIIHIDMDAFYASVEQRDNPDLRGKPVAVGGSRERGVVAAASYEARKFGVRSAMPSITAQRQCPDLIFVKPRFDVYKSISQQIREIFAEHTPIIEPLSLDEAYLDVIENLQNIPLARDIALAIRAKIKAETGLNASAGISYNKFLAKLASDHRKPNGQYVITPEMGPPFVEALPVGKFHGIGPATNTKMHGLGIFTGLDLRNQNLAFLEANFGKGRRLLLFDLAWHRRTAGARQPHPEIGRCRKHLLLGPDGIRTDGCRTAAPRRQGLAALRKHRHSRADRHAENQVCGFRDHLAQPVAGAARRKSARTRTCCGRIA
jgi:nucleotidyltransferase/DNA polymerase involved in DNA repair